MQETYLIWTEGRRLTSKLHTKHQTLTSILVERIQNIDTNLCPLHTDHSYINHCKLQKTLWHQSFYTAHNTFWQQSLQAPNETHSQQSLYKLNETSEHQSVASSSSHSNNASCSLKGRELLQWLSYYYIFNKEVSKYVSQYVRWILAIKGNP
jgi:hypothetical protein